MSKIKLEKMNENMTIDFIKKHFDEIDIESLLIKIKLPEDFIVEKFDEFKPFIKTLCICQKLSEDFIEKHKDELKWNLICIHQKLSEEFIEKHKDYVDWDRVSMFQSLSDGFIEHHIDKIGYENSARYQLLSEDFMERHFDEIKKYDFITSTQIMSEGFLKKHINDLNLSFACSNQCLSEDFIKYCEDNGYDDKLSWYLISIYQKLSEDFIEEHIEKLSLEQIFRYNKLSISFIKRHIFGVDLNIILKYQKYDDEFFEFVYNNEIGKNYWPYFAKYHKFSDDMMKKYKVLGDGDYRFDNWLYITTEEKKNAVIKSNKYECYDDYFIAYKSVRKDGYSLFNFQYKYEKGGIYEGVCDCTSTDSSFGFGVGTMEFAETYGEKNWSKIIKCKVRYEDVGRLVHDDEKIRCFKFEVLE